LAPRQCKPNFNVVVTSDPERLLKKWRARDLSMFGPTPPRNGEQPIARFIHSDRPVRVWYNADFTDNFGATPGDSATKLLHDFEGAPTITVWSNPHLTVTALTKLSSVIIVIDPKLVKGYTLGQLTDYIGMIGLAQVNLDSEPEDAPTILRLFAASSSAAGKPDGLSSRDQAFLKGLYTTDQGSPWQRSQIVTRVVQDLAPQSWAL
jgi:hypothetical protein